MKKAKKIPSIPDSIQTCTMLIQRLGYWKALLEKCQNDLGLKANQLSKIQKQIEEMFQIGFFVHGRSEVSDEVVSRAYYDILGTLEALNSRFELWKTQTNRTNLQVFFADNPDLKEEFIIEFSDVFDLKEGLNNDFDLIANHIIEGTPTDIATECVSVLFGLSEDRIRKKTKKIYK